MTEAEFMAMRDAYKTACGKVQDFSDWTEEEIEAYILQEIEADAYAGLNFFEENAVADSNENDIIREKTAGRNTPKPPVCGKACCPRSRRASAI